jgi:integration host factor subunit beta
MTRSELLKALEQRFPHLSLIEIEQFSDILFDTVTTQIALHKRVELRGFGAFYARIRSARQAKRPASDLPVILEERISIGFRASKGLKERLNDANASME